MNFAQLGKHQRAMLEFAKTYRGLHSLAKDSLTQRVAKSLRKRGLIHINEYNQFTLAYRFVTDRFARIPCSGIIRCNKITIGN